MAKKKAFLLSVIICFTFTNTILAQTHFHLPPKKSSDVTPLIGIKLISVNVLAPDILSHPIIEEIKSTVEQKLKSNTLPLFIPEPGVMYKLPPVSELKVQIEAYNFNDPNDYLFRIQMFLSQRVFSSEQKSRMFPADVWKTEPLLFESSIKNSPSKLSEAAVKQTKEFIFAYDLANPTRQTDSVTSATEKKYERSEESFTEYKYVASKNSKVFHKPDCSSAKRISKKNLIGFKTRDEAINSNRRPCKICKP